MSPDSSWATELRIMGLFSRSSLLEVGLHSKGVCSSAGNSSLCVLELQALWLDLSVDLMTKVGLRNLQAFRLHDRRAVKCEEVRGSCFREKKKST
eukprot:5221856-Amphidinium_carterae.1